jgi:hypothetical protein
VNSGGEQFFRPGQSVTLGKTGHFTFTASCTNATNGSQEGERQCRLQHQHRPRRSRSGRPAGSPVVIHKDSDADNSTTDAPLTPGDFTQVGSASCSATTSDGLLLAADNQLLG